MRIKTSGSYDARKRNAEIKKVVVSAAREAGLCAVEKWETVEIKTRILGVIPFYTIGTAYFTMCSWNDASKKIIIEIEEEENLDIMKELGARIENNQEIQVVLRLV